MGKLKRLRLSYWRKWHLVEGFRPHCNFKMKNSNYKVLFLHSNHEHSMFKFICVILSNTIHNIFESAITKVSWTKLYMLDDHYESYEYWMFCLSNVQSLLLIMIIYELLLLVN
jgi:hypothetical protein